MHFKNSCGLSNSILNLCFRLEVKVDEPTNCTYFVILIPPCLDSKFMFLNRFSLIILCYAYLFHHLSQVNRVKAPDDNWKFPQTTFTSQPKMIRNRCTVSTLKIRRLDNGYFGDVIECMCILYAGVCVLFYYSDDETQLTMKRWWQLVGQCLLVWSRIEYVLIHYI